MDPRNSNEVTTEERFDTLEIELREIKTTLEFIKDTIVNADRTISKVANEVMPTLDGLMKSPMLKMLLPKSKP